MSFSNSGGTLALPSPTHGPHQMDVSSAVRTLRRSLSRSPSKFLSRTSSKSSDHSLPASPRTPSRRFVLTPKHQHRLAIAHPQSAPPASAPTAAKSTTAPTTTPLQPPALTPLRPSVRLSLRSAKSSKTISPARHLARRPSPKSPLKRTLSNTSDVNANARPATSASPRTRLSPGQENARQGFSTIKNLEKPSRHSLHLDVTGASQTAFLKALDINPDPMLSASGALKRSDATMNLDHPNQGSPVAKRRSLHGVVTFGNPEGCSIFGSNTTSSRSFDIHEDPHSEYELSTMPVTTFHGDAISSRSPTCSVPKRSSSLRKSTLQQRSLGRRTGERQLAHLSSELSTPAKSRPRLSTDHFFPPQPADKSLFSAVSPLPNASIHPLDAKAHQPHPLSKTLTTSLSGNSLTEEGPVLQTTAKPTFDRPKPHPFSRSLPLNAVRPTAKLSHDHAKIAATPNNSNLWVGAFNSTGLISKVNRNPEDDIDKKFAPPDTPCKKHTNPFATYPLQSGSGLRKRGVSRGSFAGIPSTPFSAAPCRAPDTFSNVAKGMSIFHRGPSGLAARRGSVLSLDGEDRKLFGDRAELNSTLDADIPPTPTKNTLTPSLSNLSEQSLESPSANRTFALPLFSASKQMPPRSSTASPIERQPTPQTPQGAALPIDTSRLTISQVHETVDSAMPPPVTPTTVRDFRSSTSIFVTPVNDRTSDVDIDANLYSRFDKVEQIGKGEFSTVYRVAKTSHNLFSVSRPITPGRGLHQSPGRSEVFAVKKSRHPYTGPKDREVKLREARILQALSHAEHVVHYVDNWEHNLHLYIQTEYCEEGTLERFLAKVGREGRLDDFRIFKILQDLSLGLKEIHDAGFMHLDMKPANILINFEGALKISDFGLAQQVSTFSNVDIEGDREYMAPEILRGEAGKPADVFSLGLITIEIAANVVLPDNGPTWVALRSGDLSEVPSLTWSPSNDVCRDASGNPLDVVHSGELLASKHSRGNVPDTFSKLEFGQRPAFLVDASHPSSLDSIARWMTCKEPCARARASQILELEGLQWVAEHRSAPTTVYEGNCGLGDMSRVAIAIDSDTEMTDA